MAEAERFVVYQTGVPIALQDAINSIGGVGTLGLYTNELILSLTKARLSLSSTLLIPTSTINAATIIYWLPLGLSLNLDSNPAHTGYHQSGKNFDIWYVKDETVSPPVNRIGSGPAWTTDILPATGRSFANTALVNTSSMLFRYGNGASDTLTVAAGDALYLGSFRASADGQTEMDFGGNAAGGDPASLLLFNYFNRAEHSCLITEATNTWTLATENPSPGTGHSVNNSTGNRVSFIQGIQESPLFADYATDGIVDSATLNGFIACGVGLNSITIFSGRTGFTNINTPAPAQRAAPIFGSYTFTYLGFGFIQALEYYGFATGGVSVATFFGDSGVPPIVQNGLYVGLWM